MLPAACVVHRTDRRVRIKIPARRANDGYFENVRQKLGALRSLESVEVNPHAASVLILGGETDIDAVAGYAREEGLFNLEKAAATPLPLARRIISPLADASKKVRSITGGEIGLEEVVFTGLVGVGIYQAVRGRLAFPPWYTAFWYAFGLFTKSLMDKYNKNSVS